MVNLALPQGSKLTDVDDGTPATALAKTMETTLAQPPDLKCTPSLRNEAKDAITGLSKLEMHAWIIKKLALGNPVQWIF